MSIFDKFKKKDNAIAITDIEKLLLDVKAGFENTEEKHQGSNPLLSKNEFGVLIGGVASLMGGHPNYKSLHIGIKLHFNIVAGHLDNKFTITDKKSLFHVVENQVERGMQNDYRQFLGFWNENPAIELTQMDVPNTEIFNICKTFAEKFSRVLGEKGFLAWDLGEAVDKVRFAYSAGLIEMSNAYEVLGGISDKALDAFQSWGEYAISYICGGAYYIFRTTGMDDEKGMNMFQMLLKRVPELFYDQEKGYWRDNTWLSKQEISAIDILEAKSPESKKQYDQAMEYYEKGNEIEEEEPVKAIKLFKKALETLPDVFKQDVEVKGLILTAIGEAYIGLKEYKQAITCFHEGIKCYDKETSGYGYVAFQAGICCFELELMEEAKDYFTRACEIVGQEIFEDYDEKYTSVFQE